MALLNTSLAQSRTAGHELSIQCFSSSLPPLRVGTSIRLSLVGVRSGEPGGGVGNTSLTFTDRSVLLILPFPGVLPI